MSTMVWLALLLAAMTSGLWLLRRRLLAASCTDWGHRGLNALDGLNRIFCRRFHRLRTMHLPLPSHGPALVVANHISGLDPLLMIAVCHRPVRFLIAREQYERFGLQWLFRAVGCIPVERGGNTKPALAAARKALQRGEVVALFPHGRIQLADEPPIRLKQGIVHLAKFSGAPVYPLYIDGISGAGHTIGAVFRRSCVRLTAFAPLYYTDDEPERMLATLARQLSKPRIPLKNAGAAP